MKKIIIHGNNYIKGYERLQYLINIARDRNWDLIRLTNNEQDMNNILSSRSLFIKERLFVIEEINILNKNNIQILNKYNDDLTTIIIFHDQVIEQAKIKQLENVSKIEKYELPKILWTFLDDIYPGNIRKTISLLHNLIDREPKELVFQFIAQRFGDLYWVTCDPTSMKIDKWRVDKLKHQAKYYTKVKIKEIIEELSNIDIKSKTGGGDLITMLDFMFSKQLE